MGSEIFDRLFQLTEEDLAVVKDEINLHLRACRECIAENPPQYAEALEEADQALALALTENLTSLKPMINFLRAHCHQGLGNWDQAIAIYSSESLSTVNQETIQSLSNKCLEAMRQEAKGDARQLRRVKASEDLHAYFFNAQRGEQGGSSAGKAPK